jgi:hypothetical protein
MPRHPRLTKAALQEAIIEASRCVSSRRHVLEPIEPPPDTRRPEFGSLLFQRCLICGTLAWDKVSRLTGERISNRQYDRPYWYEQALEQGHDPAWWRATYWDTLGNEFFLEPEQKVTPIRKRKKAS